MSHWHLAPSLVRLQKDLDAVFGAERPNDGTIGDESHAARKSEHNPDRDSDGMPNGAVSAIDVYTESRGKVWIKPAEFSKILSVLKKDSRVWYVIHKGKIYSRTNDFAAKAYEGSNPHNSHFHLSLMQTKRAHDDDHSWGIADVDEAPKPDPKPDDPEKPAEKKLPTLNLGDSHDYLVPVLKRFLGIRNDSPKFDSALADSVQKYQRSRGLERDGVVGPKTWGAILKGLSLPGWKV